MAIVQLPLPIAANTGVTPNIKTMTTTDSYATITTAGYLNAGNLQGYPVGPQDVLHIIYSYDLNTKTGTFGIFTVSLSNGVLTLSEDKTTNEVTYTSSAANNIAVFTNSTGNIGYNFNPAINPGDIQAGLASGTAGKFISYSGIANKGSLALQAAEAGGNYNVILSNTEMHQATTFFLSDPLVATTTVVFQNNTSIPGNVMAADTSSGGIKDVGFALHGAVTATWGGGGTSNGFAATGLTTSSIVVASIKTSTNTVSIAKVVPTTNTLTVTFSADPGANTSVSWIMLSAAG